MVRGGEVETMYELAASQNLNLCVGTLLMVSSSLIHLGLTEQFGGLVDLLHSSPGALPAATASILAFYALLALINTLRLHLLELAAERVCTKIRVGLYSSLLRQPLTFFDLPGHGSASLVNRLSDDAVVLADSTTKELSTGLGAALTLIIGIYNMLSVSRSLSILALTIVTPLGLGTLLLSWGLRAHRARVQDAVSNSMQLAQERLSSIPTVRAFGQEEGEVDRFTSSCAVGSALQTRTSLIHAIFHGAIDLVIGVMVGAVLWWGGAMLRDGLISPGTLAGFLLYSRHVGFSLMGVSNWYSSILKGLAASGRIQGVIEGPPDQDNEPLKNPTTTTTPNSQTSLTERKIGSNTRVEVGAAVQGAIRFHSVSFTYPSRPQTQVLTDINLDIPAGSTFAIYGASGSGKSTLAALLLRLYDLKDGQGSIKFDGVNIGGLNGDWLRRQIGYVPQDPVLFSGSIRSNILYGLGSDPSQFSTYGDLEALLYKVALDSNALEFIQKLPSKFDTILGERAHTLSGGQVARIAIARALIKNPKILLFDEATAALDPENEGLIQQALVRATVGKSRTLIIIAHRLSTIQSADKIGVISDGKLAEVGSMAELMANPFGKFKRSLLTSSSPP